MIDFLTDPTDIVTSSEELKTVYSLKSAKTDTKFHNLIYKFSTINDPKRVTTHNFKVMNSTKCEQDCRKIEYLKIMD